MSKFKKQFSVFILILFIFSNLIANQVSAIEYGGFGLRSADLKNGVARKVDNFTYQMNPETSKEDGLMVVNNSKEKKTFLVYAADSVKSTDGGFACRQYSEAKEKVGSWIKLDKEEVTLNPGTNEIIKFTITTPDKLDTGEHNGCFLVQEKKEESKDSAKKSGIQLSIRTGIRVSVIVPGDIKRELVLKDFKLTNKPNGNFVFNSSIENKGNVSIKTDVKVKVTNLLGIKHKDLGGEFVILRDETSVWNFELKKPFFGGFYKAKLVANYNKNGGELSEKENIIKLESEKEITFFSFPTVNGLAIEIAVLIFILYCLYLLSIWKQRQDWIKTWKSYKVARATNIKVLAEKYDVNWKLLASVNKIKAPYMVSSKDELVVPSDTEDVYNNKTKKNSLVTKINNLFKPKKSNKK